MRTEHRLVLLLALGAGCDRSGQELLPQPNDAFPAVLEIGELQVLATDSETVFDPSACNEQDENGAYNCYYGQLSPTDGVTIGGATFSFTGTGGEVCVVVDPESLFWNQFIGSSDAAYLWGYPDIDDDDGDLDLFGGLSSYYTGSPGVELGDFSGFYTDSLGREIEIDYVECFNESPYFEGEEAHAGRGAPEYCKIDTTGREGILYTVVLETFSVPRDDGILSFGTVVLDGECGSTGGLGGAAGITECTMMGDAVEIDGSVRDCSMERELAFCLNGEEGASSKKILSRFCCQNPSACGDDPPDGFCDELEMDTFCTEYPELCGCEG